MKPTLEIGTARAEAHKIVYGAFEALELPSGGHDSFPIIIAQGDPDGPVLWVTAGIHGAEYTGIPVITNCSRLIWLKGCVELSSEYRR